MNLLVDGLIFELRKKGGVNRIFSEVLPRICRIDPSMQVTILLKHEAFPIEMEDVANISYVLTPNYEKYLRPGRWWATLKPVIRKMVNSTFVAKSNYQLFHTTYYSELTGWDKPQVVTVYDMINEICKNDFNRKANDALIELKRKIITRADRIIAISESTKKDIADIYKITTDKIVSVPLACSSEFEITEEKRIYHKPYILYVGNRSTYKNFQRLLKVYSSWKHSQEIDLVVVGDMVNEYEKAEIGKLKLNDRVTFLGFISDKNLNNFYNYATAFVYPSYYEGFGIPLLEAISSGCPIVASRIPSTLEIAENYPYYFTVDQNDEFETALTLAVENGRSIGRIHIAQEIKLKYTWESTAEKYYKLYKQLA